MPLAEVLPHSISPYLTLMVIGFVVGAVGHLYKSKIAVLIGILMIFLATLLLPLALIATEEEPPSNPDILAPGTR
jgi:sulfite exporter TauE/SafE